MGTCVHTVQKRMLVAMELELGCEPPMPVQETKPWPSGKEYTFLKTEPFLQFLKFLKVNALCLTVQ